jgi:hypothetical protein
MVTSEYASRRRLLRTRKSAAFLAIEGPGASSRHFSMNDFSKINSNYEKICLFCVYGETEHRHE